MMRYPQPHHQQPQAQQGQPMVQPASGSYGLIDTETGIELKHTVCITKLPSYIDHDTLKRTLQEMFSTSICFLDCHVLKSSMSTIATVVFSDPNVVKTLIHQQYVQLRVTNLNDETSEVRYCSVQCSPFNPLRRPPFLSSKVLHYEQALQQAISNSEKHWPISGGNGSSPPSSIGMSNNSIGANTTSTNTSSDSLGLIEIEIIEVEKPSNAICRGESASWKLVLQNSGTSTLQLCGINLVQVEDRQFDISPFKSADSFLYFQSNTVKKSRSIIPLKPGDKNVSIISFEGSYFGESTAIVQFEFVDDTTREHLIQMTVTPNTSDFNDLREDSKFAYSLYDIQLPVWDGILRNLIPLSSTPSTVANFPLGSFSIENSSIARAISSIETPPEVKIPLGEYPLPDELTPFTHSTTTAIIRIPPSNDASEKNLNLNLEQSGVWSPLNANSAFHQYLQQQSGSSSQTALHRALFAEETREQSSLLRAIIKSVSLQPFIPKQHTDSMEENGASARSNNLRIRTTDYSNTFLYQTAVNALQSQEVGMLYSLHLSEEDRKWPPVVPGARLVIWEDETADVEYEALVVCYESENSVVLLLNPIFSERYPVNPNQAGSSPMAESPLEYTKFNGRLIYNRNTMRLLHRAVDLVDEKTVIIPPPVSGKKPGRSLVSLDELDKLCPAPTQAQKETLLSIVNQSLGIQIPYIVEGPSGTGTSTTLVQAVKLLLSRRPDARILIVTSSMEALFQLSADLIQDVNPASVLSVLPPWKRASKLTGLEQSQNPESSLTRQFLATSNYSTVHGAFLPPSMEQLREKKVVLSTALDSGVLYSIGVPSGFFSHMFMDNAGNISEVEARIPQCLVDVEKTQLVYFGDAMQQISLNGRQIIVPQLTVSILDRLLNFYDSVRKERVETNQWKKPTKTTPDNVFRLKENFTHDPHLIQLISHLFYDGTLNSNSDALLARHHRQKSGVYPKNIDYPILFHSVTGREDQERPSSSFYNSVEACVAVSIAEAYVLSNSIPQDMIAVVSPFWKQRQKLALLLKKHELMGVRVCSDISICRAHVKVVIVSPVRANRTLLRAYDEHYNVGLIGHPQRLNSILSSALDSLIVVGDPYTLFADDHWKYLITQCIQHNSYLGPMLSGEYLEKRSNLEDALNGNKETFRLSEVVFDECEEVELTAPPTAPSSPRGMHMVPGAAELHQMGSASRYMPQRLIESELGFDQIFQPSNQSNKPLQQPVGSGRESSMTGMNSIGMDRILALGGSDPTSGLSLHHSLGVEIGNQSADGNDMFNMNSSNGGLVGHRKDGGFRDSSSSIPSLSMSPSQNQMIHQQPTQSSRGMNMIGNSTWGSLSSHPMQSSNLSHQPRTSQLGHQQSSQQQQLHPHHSSVSPTEVSWMEVLYVIAKLNSNYPRVIIYGNKRCTPSFRVTSDTYDTVKIDISLFGLERPVVNVLENRYIQILLKRALANQQGVEFCLDSIHNQYAQDESQGPYGTQGVVHPARLLDESVMLVEITPNAGIDLQSLATQTIGHPPLQLSLVLVSPGTT